MSTENESIQRIVDWVDRSGLEGPAVALIEGLKPLGLLGAQAMYLAAPFLSPLGISLEGFAAILEDPEAISTVSKRIDRRESGT